MGRQRSVPCGMPLLCNLREQTGQIIFTGEDPFPGAYGTAVSRDPSGYFRLPGMSLGTQPPNFTMTSRQDLPGSQSTITRRMPLLCQLWMDSIQVVFSGYQHPIGTDGAVTAADSGFDLSLPHMALWTKPPYFPVAAGKDLCWQ